MKKVTRVGCASAVLIRPELLIIRIGWGAIFGIAAPSFDAVGASSTPESGARGVMNAIETLVVYYVLTLGIVPIVISFIGAGLGMSVARLVSPRK